MKVWQCDSTRPIPGLMPANVERPVPGPGELLIRVHAAGVTPTELQWYPTMHTKSGAPRRNAIPGHEFSGVVAATGAGVVDVAVGQEVFGMSDWFAEGASAEFCCTLSSWVSPKPARLTHVEAASVPIGALTAWQGLFDRAELKPGERVLIHGGSGAVGIFAIQLARWRGAHVFTTASARNRDVLLGLGAERVIDYHVERFEDVAKEVDIVFDTIGGSTLERSWDVLGPGGRLVTVATSSEGEQNERTKRAFFIVEPNRQQLCEIAGLLDDGRLQTAVDAVVPFDEGAAAYERRPMPRRGYGKTVITVIPAS